MTENEITYITRGVIFEIYNHFGPGLFKVFIKKLYMFRLRTRDYLLKRKWALWQNTKI